MNRTQKTQTSAAALPPSGEGILNVLSCLLPQPKNQKPFHQVWQRTSFRHLGLFFLTHFVSLVTLSTFLSPSGPRLSSAELRGGGDSGSSDLTGAVIKLQRDQGRERLFCSGR